jgi:hypothetical protein
VIADKAAWRPWCLWRSCSRIRAGDKAKARVYRGERIESEETMVWTTMVTTATATM